MMNERRRKLQTIKVDHYDGQSIYSNDELIYELGGYLGGGAAGVYVVTTHAILLLAFIPESYECYVHLYMAVDSVYEAFCMRTKQVRHTIWRSSHTTSLARIILTHIDPSTHSTWRSRS